MTTKKYINHSGGCPGADMTWENLGKPYGVKSIAYSFYNHVQEGENQKILTYDELQEGWRHVEIASASLKRPLERIQYPYVKNLISRNWYQVKNADSIFAIGKFDGKLKARVSGGTGWAVQMAIDNKKPIYFFDQPTDEWYIYVYYENKFLRFYDEPTLTENFAGIGTREMNTFGVRAIELVYEHTFKK